MTLPTQDDVLGYFGALSNWGGGGTTTSSAP
ncbi:hypothetical protein BJ973_002783 [Actinoplanes tereljensis]